MSVIQEQRNSLVKRFGKQAVVIVDDSLYSVEKLTPNAGNKRLFPVHSDAIVRLNNTMEGHIRGNSQIFYTMLWKDQNRGKLLVDFWNELISRPEFKALPKQLQELERQQARKLGPTSRFSIKKLYDGFISHIDETAEQRNEHLDEYKEGSEYFINYLVEVARRCQSRNPKLYSKIVDNFGNITKAFDNLNKDKSGGDRYFIRVDREIAGVNANELYLKDARKIQQNPSKEEYFEMFRRVQNKGNTIIPDDVTPITAKDIDFDNIWLEEKNRVVQGDSRSIQFLMKNISDVVTKILKEVDPNFCGWLDEDEKREIIGKYLSEFKDKFDFDSFDATEYDASTAKDNFELGIHIMYELCRRLGLNPDALYPEDDCIRHYLYDATLTPWGAFHRKGSTPSGSNFTGPNGTLTNMLRCYIQTARLFKMSFEQFNRLLLDYVDKGIPLWMCVGDDAVSLREKGRTKEDIAKENNLDGYLTGDEKVELHEYYIHFLQHGYLYDVDTKKYYLGYYPVSRLMEHCWFQEEADQYTSEGVSVQAVDQNIYNCRFNPLQDFAIEFCMRGDPKFRLGSIMGVMNLFRKAAGYQTVAEFLGREWDPSYQGMTWKEFGVKFRPTARKIEQIGRKLYS